MVNDNQFDTNTKFSHGGNLSIQDLPSPQEVVNSITANNNQQLTDNIDSGNQDHDESDDLSIKNNVRSKLTTSDIKLILYLIITIKPFKYIGDRSLSQTKKWELIQKRFSEIKQKSNDSSGNPGVIIPTVRTLQRQLSSAIKKCKLRNNSESLLNNKHDPIFRNIKEDSSLMDLELAVSELFELSETLKNGKIANSSLLELSLESHGNEGDNSNFNNNYHDHPLSMTLPNPQSLNPSLSPLNTIAPLNQNYSPYYVNQLPATIPPANFPPKINIRSMSQTTMISPLNSFNQPYNQFQISRSKSFDQGTHPKDFYRSEETLLDHSNITVLNDINNIRNSISAYLDSNSKPSSISSASTSAISPKLSNLNSSAHSSISNSSSSAYIVELIENLNNKSNDLKTKEQNRLSSYQQALENFNQQQYLINKQLIEKVVDNLKSNGDVENSKLISTLLPKK
ncbi:hypothetical protein CLIB1444_02S03070 [[Candida] jaroonii]|uniref:Uncharacterized protein n=1 Tax=[Candida] jaroonii TaxID=467808 RepID=A0ACA9Y2K2_9ASCO|nr:hypothetical protein CLIB1444_02S03070 [[Candida] jaroonii]